MVTGDSRMRSGVLEAETTTSSNTVDASAFMVTVNRDVYYGADKVENVPVVSVSQDYTKVMPFDLQEGRYFTPAESYSGRNIAIIGADIAEGLFKGRDAIGKQIKVFGLSQLSPGFNHFRKG